MYGRGDKNRERESATDGPDAIDGNGGSIGFTDGGTDGSDREPYDGDPLTAGEIPGNREQIASDRRETSSDSSNTSSDGGNNQPVDGGNSGRKQRRGRYRKGSKQQASGAGKRASEANQPEKGKPQIEDEKPPNPVNFNEVLNSVGLNPELDLDEAALSQAIQFITLGPEYLGWGDHWPVGKKQADACAKAWCQAWNSLEIKKNSILAKAGEYGKKLLPWVSALWITHTIFTPRMMKRQELLEMQKAKEQYERFQTLYGRRVAPVQPEPQSAASSSNGNAAGNAAQPGVDAGFPPSASDYSKFAN